MINRNGPFQIFDTEGGCTNQPSSESFSSVSTNSKGQVDSPLPPPRRRYSCKNYSTCLNLAAALNWDNFTCRGCSGEIDESLYWRARQEIKKDTVVRTLCDLPEIQLHESQEANGATVIPLVVKR